MSCPCLGGGKEEKRDHQYAVPSGVVPGQASMHSDAQAVPIGVVPCQPMGPGLRPRLDSRPDDVPVRVPIYVLNNNSKTNQALIRSAEQGDVDRCRALLADGAEINCRDERGNQYECTQYTPLHAAMENGHAEACKLLVEGRADVNAQDRYNRTPLHVAAENGDAEACKLLLVEGRADVNACALRGRRPLHEAAIQGHAEKCKVLVEGRADVNVRDSGNYICGVWEHGRTPLHMAVENGHAEACKVLLVEGRADVNAKYSRGPRDGPPRGALGTPLELAEFHGRSEVAALLREHGGSSWQNCQE